MRRAVRALRTASSLGRKCAAGGVEIYPGELAPVLGHTKLDAEGLGIAGFKGGYDFQGIALDLIRGRVVLAAEHF